MTHLSGQPTIAGTLPLSLLEWWRLQVDPLRFEERTDTDKAHRDHAYLAGYTMFSVAFKIVKDWETANDAVDSAIVNLAEQSRVSENGEKCDGFRYVPPTNYCWWKTIDGYVVPPSPQVYKAVTRNAVREFRLRRGQPLDEWTCEAELRQVQLEDASDERQKYNSEKYIALLKFVLSLTDETLQRFFVLHYLNNLKFDDIQKSGEILGDLSHKNRVLRKQLAVFEALFAGGTL